MIDDILNPVAPSPLTAEQLHSLAVSVIERARTNPSNLTEPGLVAAVAAQIGEAVGRPSSPNEKPSGWTRRRPTKPGWYWLKLTPTRTEAVRVYSGVAGLCTDVGLVANIVGMWQGPIPVPT